ncbi:hypothetical protein [Nocardioides cavernaquae]|uniref:LppX_LprAFG lipoprotein n=1 Tax=Nocardioides cavernaquae TaxID=2321396 RepID=A0A3A5HA72_9ACTN|nr:hypothetical protein [Nocardioides cavernaquae]RJS47539.1 hypothetical protein D4739_15845 [Nocardioides cavernaquae]
MDFRHIKLTRSLAACAVVGTLVLTGCGDKDGAAKDGAAKDEAANSSPTSGSTSPSPSGPTAGSSSADASDPSKGQAVSVESFVDDLKDGNSDVSSSHARIVMEVAGQRVVTEGDIDASGKDPEAIMTMTLPQVGKAEIRLVEGSFYMRMPGVAEDKFMVVDLDDAPGDIAQSLKSMDPAAQVDEFAKAIRAVTYLGETERSGVEVDRYRVRMDSSQLASLAGGASLPDTVVMELYLDDDNRMRGMQMEMPVQGKKFVMDGTFSQFGKDVDVQKPPASQLMANG